jgi:hypothetical protein
MESSSKIKFNIEIKDNKVTCYLNDIEHFCFKYTDYRGYQTWLELDEGRYRIEVYLRGRDMLLEYNSIEKFKSCLKCLSQIKF